MDVARCGIASSRVIIKLKRELCQVTNDIMVSASCLSVQESLTLFTNNGFNIGSVVAKAYVLIVTQLFLLASMSIHVLYSH